MNDWSLTAGRYGLRSLALTAALLCAAGVVVSISGAGETMPPWERVYLVHWPNELEPCRPARDREAAVVLHASAGPAGKIGSMFSVVVPPARIVQGRLVATVTPEDCTRLYEPFPLPRGVLQLDVPIDWDALDSSWLLAVAGPRLAARQVGSVTGLDEAARGLYLAAIRKHLPAGSPIGVWHAARFTMPGSGARYVFVRVNRLMEDDNEQAEPRGFVFAEASGAPRLLVAEPGLMEVIAIVDLDDNGVAEMVVADAGRWDVRYGVRLFDGARLSESKRTLLHFQD